MTARLATETIPSNNHSVSKVSSISTTNENKGINITGSHEVNGNDKSSTNGTPATAGKVGAPSLDALALATKTLQRQKERNEKMDKMKKLPMVCFTAHCFKAVYISIGLKILRLRTVVVERISYDI